MRTRPVYLVALGVAVVGFAAYLTVPAALRRYHRDARERAWLMATTMPEPAGATARAPGRCVGDEGLRCTRVDRPPDLVAEEVAAALRARGVKADPRCDDVYMSPDARFGVRECWIIVKTGFGHGAAATVTTEVLTSGGTARMGGSVVDVSWYG